MKLSREFEDEFHFIGNKKNVWEGRKEGTKKLGETVNEESIAY